MTADHTSIRKQLTQPTRSHRLIRLPEVRHITAMSRSQIYALIRQRKFPPGVKLSERIRAWRLADIDAWVAERVSASRD